jgi:hypothetical protein
MYYTSIRSILFGRALRCIEFYVSERPYQNSSTYILYCRSHVKRRERFREYEIIRIFCIF